MVNGEELIQLSNRGKPGCPVSRLGFGPIADKFFVVGALSSVIGTGWIGAHMWLSLNGQLPMKSFYVDMRELHVLIQMYLFLGFFVLGFLAQAGPKIVGAKLPPSPLTLLWIPLSVLGVVFWYTLPESIIGKGIISGVYISAILYAARFQQSGEPTLSATAGRLNLLGLFGFALSPILPLEESSVALIIFWSGVGALIIGSGQQFIAAFLGGTRCSKRQAHYLFILVLVTGAALSLSPVLKMSVLSNLAGFFASVTIGYYVYCTKLYLGYRTAHQDGLALSFLISFFWAIVGSFILLYQGNGISDLVFHLWAIGWATPLILAVSGQIMGFMSGKNITKNPLFISALIFWQIVPVGRALLPYVKFPASFSWLVSTSASTVLIFWCYQLLSAERLLIARGKVMQKKLASGSGRGQR